MHDDVNFQKNGEYACARIRHDGHLTPGSMSIRGVCRRENLNRKVSSPTFPGVSGGLPYCVCN